MHFSAAFGFVAAILATATNAQFRGPHGTQGQGFQIMLVTGEQSRAFNTDFLTVGPNRQLVRSQSQQLNAPRWFHNPQTGSIQTQIDGTTYSLALNVPFVPSRFGNSYNPVGVRTGANSGTAFFFGEGDTTLLFGSGAQGGGQQPQGFAMCLPGNNQGAVLRRQLPGKPRDSQCNYVSLKAIA